MSEDKDIWWEGTSKADLSEFPADARHLMGYQLHIVQCGDMPEDWKLLKHLGKGITGVYEIRISVEKNIYRTAYVTKFSDVVTVLHCWQKKTQQTSQADKDLIVLRYRSAKETLT